VSRALRLAIQVAIFLAGFGGAPARAASDATAWQLVVDNDYFNFWQGPHERPDFGYTHGSELVWEGAQAPHTLARLAPAWAAGTDKHDGPVRLQIRLRQAIYAPWRLPPDRPYGGWLGLGVGIHRETATARRDALVHIGVTGPPSQAARLQRYIHRRFGFGTPPDWSGEIPYEPGVAIEVAGARQSFVRGNDRALQIHGGPQWRARLGTYAVDARIGLAATAGIHPPTPWNGTRRTPGTGALYLIAAARLDIIARDELLDGTLFRHSDGVSATPLVPEFETGIGIRLQRARFEWHITRRAKEYRIQPVPHTYSSLVFTLER